jgi:hypothetical protein
MGEKILVRQNGGASFVVKLSIETLLNTTSAKLLIRPDDKETVILVLLYSVFKEIHHIF